MDRKLAEQIVALVNGCVDQLIATLDPVEAAVSPEEFAAYKRAVSKAVSSLDAGIIDLVARQYPELKPVDDDVEPSREPDPPKSSHN